TRLRAYDGHRRGSSGQLDILRPAAQNGRAASRRDATPPTATRRALRRRDRRLGVRRVGHDLPARRGGPVGLPARAREGISARLVPAQPAGARPQLLGPARGLEWFLPKLAVAFAADGEPRVAEPILNEPENLHGRVRMTCRLCGECNVGCNYGSKNTLDFNYLSEAALRHGASIFTRCEVKS